MDRTIFSTVEEAIEEIASGKMIIILDDENRENEGDLVMAAEYATPEAVNFMVTSARGLLCAPMDVEVAEKLDLIPMIQKNTDPNGTAFTISVDAVDSTTGISAYERSNTLLKLANSKSKSTDFWRPGHIFPLIAKPNGVLARIGHTEAAVDLAKLAGLEPVGAICEILNEDGTMARLPQLVEFGKKHGLKLLTIAELVRWRKEKEELRLPAAVADLPTKYGNFKICAYESQDGREPNLAIIKGELGEQDDVLIRLHSECLTGDILGSCRCDCGNQLASALKMIEKEGRGAVLYLRQEGRGIGLINKLKAYVLQEEGKDTVEANHLLGFPADLRDFSEAAKIIKLLGVKSVRLLTNNPDKIEKLERAGISITERIPIITEIQEHNKKYIETKVEKMRHLF
jgi:GTP cyclohydrolase II/3,4-dihydroxy-2-butanone 4-phosphate synthase